MRWSDRMRRAIETFKRMALPLYSWYFALAALGFIVFLISMIPLFLTMKQSDFERFVPGFSGSFPNPAQPVPPGNLFSPGVTPGSGEFSQLLALAPKLLLAIAILSLFGWLFYSFLTTGVFHLTKKAYTSSQAKFRDFRLEGFWRVLGWQALLFSLFLLFALAGVIIYFSLRNVAYAGPLLLFVYALTLLSLGIFMAPWLSTTVYYLLNNLDLTLRQALRKSWDLYWQNKLSFWSYLLTAIGIQTLAVSVSEASEGLGFLLSLITTPFLSILPIVWILTHEETSSPMAQTLSADESAPEVHPASTNLLADHPVEIVSDQDTIISTCPPNSEPPLPLIPSPVCPSVCSAQTISLSETDNSTEQVNFCPTCGKPRRPGANYCSQCGTIL